LIADLRDALCNSVSMQRAQNLKRLQHHQRQRPLLYIPLLLHRPRSAPSIWLPKGVCHGFVGKATGEGKQDRIAHLDQALNVVRKEVKAGLFRHGQPTAHLVESVKIFAAFLRQIAPIVPVLPVYKSFAVNIMRAQCYLDTVQLCFSFWHEEGIHVG
jgi:hypothetical protein